MSLYFIILKLLCRIEKIKEENTDLIGQNGKKRLLSRIFESIVLFAEMVTHTN